MRAANVVIFIILLYLLINAIITRFAIGGKNGEQLFNDAIIEGSDETGVEKKQFKTAMFITCYLLALPCAIATIFVCRKNKSR